MTRARFWTSLPRTADAPGIARRLLEQWLPQLTRQELNSARLLASELVASAVVHGQGVINLRAELDADRLLVEVIDEGHGFERTIRLRHFESVGGRGLGIVDTVASRWGIHEGTTHVWFELERPGPPDRDPTTSPPETSTGGPRFRQQRRVCSCGGAIDLVARSRASS